METLTLSYPHPSVCQVTLSRSKTLNAMSLKMYSELQSTFESLGNNPDIRAIVLTGSERSFCSGMDLQDFASFANFETEDPARRALRLEKGVKSLQAPISAVEHCGKPVIAAVSGYCIGAGVDLISACDIRYCAKNAVISVREVVIGMAADIGSLQRLPKVIGNNSWLREMVFTGRNANAEEALRNGVFSRMFEDYGQVVKAALDLAKEIAERSPIAIIGSKRNLDYARDHTVQEGLDHIARWNSWATQSPDFMHAIVAQIQKKKIEFPKL